MKRTIGNIPSSYQVSMSYEEQVEEIRNKVKQILDDNNIIIENYNEIVEQYNIINQKYDDIIVDYEEILGEYQNLLERINTNTSNITSLQEDVSTNTSNISSLQEDVSTNTSNISSLQEDVSTNTEEINNIKEDYLPLIGGSITGNLSVGGTFNVGSGKLSVGNTYVNSNMEIRSEAGMIIGQTTDTVDRQLTIRNQGHQANLVAKASGVLGLWSTTMGKYVFATYNGILELNGGKLVIANDGKSTFANDILLKKTNTNAYIYIGDTAYRKINEFQTENNSIKVGLGTDANGDFRIYDYTHSKDILRDTSAGVITFNGSASENLLKKNIARGVVSITPSGANTPTAVNVTWSQMDGVPTVVAIPNVGDGLTAIYNVGVTDVTKTGCKLWLRASNTNARNIMYIAIYK